MKTFQPKIEIRLIKSSRRPVVAPGVATASRYAICESIDLTPYLADSTPVSISKSVREASGGWSMTLIDKMMPEFNETLYAMIEPMDIIEFRLAHSPHEYNGSSGVNKYKLPVVMRGFVSVIARTRTMSSGQPTRTISLSGHDFGKLLEILRIYYLNNSVVGDNIVGGFRFFQKYAGLGETKIKTCAEFAELVLDKVINPYVENLTGLANGQRVEATVIKSISSDVSIKGTVSPDAVSVFEDGSVHQFLSQFLDIGAFNEMFVEDREKSVVLVIRPNPFRSVKNFPIQFGSDVATISIDDLDVESITESRSDGNVANYYWTTNSGWQIIDNQQVRQLADAGDPSVYAPMKYINCDATRYGFRKIEVAVMTGPPSQEYPDAMNESKKKTETDLRLDWLVDRRRVLAEQNKDNVVFEIGEMTIRGNERLKAGMYLEVNYNGFRVLHYVTHVQHDFQPFAAFKTRVSFERGTGFINRAQPSAAPYVAELNQNGAI